MGMFGFDRRSASRTVRPLQWAVQARGGTSPQPPLPASSFTTFQESSAPAPSLPYDIHVIDGAPFAPPLGYDLAALQPDIGSALACPVNLPAHLVSPFGPRTRPKEFHNGVDLRNRLNSSVFADEDGTLSVFHNDQGGNSIVLRGSDQSRSGYAHTRSMKPDGARVRAGEQIGVSDTSGHQDAPHLHFTYTPPHSTAKVDPLSILRHVCGRGNF